MKLMHDYLFIQQRQTEITHFCNERAKLRFNQYSKFSVKGRGGAISHLIGCCPGHFSNLSNCTTASQASIVPSQDYS